MMIIGQHWVGWTSANREPTKRADSRSAFSIPEASLEGIATLAITIMCSGQNRCGTNAEEWIRGPVDDVRAFSVHSRRRLPC